jgi:hypothetical protein
VKVKLTIEDSLKENSKGRKPSTDLVQPVDGKLTINSNPFVTELQIKSLKINNLTIICYEKIIPF